ncbi:hypothetical protein AYI69_g4915 [Smittium culicis]|uniref:Uncharacterized protein n=1 Tax=Smittium culicis TaxID=133412 RepID=A0A1R1Y9J5_9FUNG|nr:hypothetical protein AYI69_g4915 [Smittium culicis]
MMDQEDPYVTTRIPLTDLAVYPELIEAFPSIEEDFFRTPLTEERKESARSCPKSSSMNYLPPPLNDSVYTADNPGLTTEDQHIVFSNKMRVLLADIDSLITQGRRDNLQKGMELPGKLHQLIESESKPLMDQEKLNALISSKKPEKRSKIRKSFCRRQQISAQNGT